MAQFPHFSFFTLKNISKYKSSDIKLWKLKSKFILRYWDIEKKTRLFQGVTYYAQLYLENNFIINDSIGF